MSQPWPMGDRLPDEPLPPEIDRAKLDAAVEGASDPAGLTTAFVVVYTGRLVAERYMPGITQDTQVENWSMGKSLTSTLFALVVKDGTYTLEQPAPVPEWRAPGDPRGQIRLMDLLRMSSGLRFVAPRDPDYRPTGAIPTTSTSIRARSTSSSIPSTNRCSSRSTRRGATATATR